MLINCVVHYFNILLKNKVTMLLLIMQNIGVFKRWNVIGAKIPYLGLSNSVGWLE